MSANAFVISLKNYFREKLKKQKLDPLNLSLQKPLAKLEEKDLRYRFYEQLFHK